jgi:hypothetical protein
MFEGGFGFLAFGFRLKSRWRNVGNKIKNQKPKTQNPNERMIDPPRFHLEDK